MASAVRNASAMVILRFAESSRVLNNYILLLKFSCVVFFRINKKYILNTSLKIINVKKNHPRPYLLYAIALIYNA